MFGLVENWELMNFFVYLGVLLFIAKVIKEKVPFLNKVIIPSALIAGTIGLILSDGFLNVINLSEPMYEVYSTDATTVVFDDSQEYLILTAEEADALAVVDFNIENF